MTQSLDSFKCRETLKVGNKSYVYFSLTTAEKNGLKGIAKLPHSMRVLLENLLRHEDGTTVTADDIRGLAQWDPAALPDRGTYRAQAERIVREADILKASDEDLLWLYPGQSAEKSAHLLHAMGPRLVVVTQGPRGAFAVTAGQQAAVPAPSVEVIDTIGAGDAFQAALLNALMQPDGTVEIPATHHELKAILLRCALAGALACTRAGAQPATRDEISEAGTAARANRGRELDGDAPGCAHR